LTLNKIELSIRNLSILLTEACKCTREYFAHHE